VRVCVCVCVCERERESRENPIVGTTHISTRSSVVFSCLRLCVLCVCVCVCVRERERARERACVLES